MNLVKAYLAKPSTQKILSRKPGDKGFSLIELVVVVAVLAILSAIAIPAFTNISANAAHASAKNTLATVAKECATHFANNAQGQDHALITGGNGIHIASTNASNNCGTQTAPTKICLFVDAGTPATYCVSAAGPKETGALNTVVTGSTALGSFTPALAAGTTPPAATAW